MPVTDIQEGLPLVNPGLSFNLSLPSPGVSFGTPYPYTSGGYEQVLAEKRAAEQREERMWRQRYAESAFDNAAKSPAGAVGAFQIMPITYKDYLERGKGKPGDLTDPAYNRKVRDFVLGIIPRDLGSLWSKESPEEINLAKRYAAYNWGAGSLRSYLRKKQKEGIDIHNSLDWMAGLPKETRDYVNFIVFNQDVPNTSKMADLYQAAREKYNFATGGRLRKLVQRINETSNADFVKRLLDEKRAVLKNDDGTVSTHELGYVTEGDRAVVFPFVQSTDNGLARFTMPDALNRAVERGDTLQMSVPEAELFTKKYKKYYPGFHSYDGDSEPTGQMMLIGEDGNPIDVLPGAVSTFNILSDYNRRQVKRLARNDYANVGEKTREFDKDWQTRVYNRAWNRADREYRNQENRKALRRAAIQELQTGVPTGAFKAHVGQGIESAAPFAMGLVLSAAGPALGGLRTVGDLAKATGVAGRGVAKGLEWVGEKAMPSALLKGAAYYLPDVAGEVATVAPYADAAALTYWGYQAAEAAREAGREGKNAEAASYGALSALPLVPAAVGAVGRAKNLLNSVKRLPDLDKSLELQYKLASGVSPEELLTSDLISSYADVPFLSASNARKARTAAEASRAAAEAVPAPARVAGAEWSPEELARLQAMAGTQQMDLSAYTPEQIAQAQAQMQADAPIIHDALAGNRATGAAERFISSGPVAGAKMASGYQIERYPGYMLKSLMEGNPLEKQLSKSGEINVGNLRNYMKSKDIKAVDKAVMEKVLASEEFAGKKSIDYNKFRKAVQDELITYDRTPDTRWADYGVARLGLYIDSELNARSAFLQDHPELHWQYYVTNDGYQFGVPGERYIADSEVEAMYPGWRKKYEKKKISPETFTFSSSRIHSGSAKHYDPNTLGHSRTYTTTDEPDVLHVMESQSDWAQSRRGNMLTVPINEESANEYKIFLEDKIKELEAGGYDEVQIAPFREELQRHLSRWKAAYDSNSVQEQSNHLINNYTARQIQENLRYAAEKGQTKMRYPTRETAAKIEGYTKNRTRALQEDPELQKEYDNIGKALREEEKRIVKKYAPDDYLDDYLREADFGDMNLSEEETNRLVDQIRRSEEFDRSPEAQKMRDEIVAARQKLNQDKWLEEHAPEMYLKEHESILKKYDAFPKQFKKLYKNADVRIVTDSKGNTWYEVDVPENYLKQEWAYADGGLLNRLSTHYNGDTEKIRELISKVRAKQLA